MKFSILGEKKKYNKKQLNSTKCLQEQDGEWFT